VATPIMKGMSCPVVDKEWTLVMEFLFSMSSTPVTLHIKVDILIVSTKYRESLYSNKYYCHFLGWCIIPFLSVRQPSCWFARLSKTILEICSQIGNKISVPGSMCPRVDKLFIKEKYQDSFYVRDEEKKWYDRSKWPTSSHYSRKYSINQDRTMSKWNVDQLSPNIYAHAAQDLENPPRAHFHPIAGIPAGHWYCRKIARNRTLELKDFHIFHCLSIWHGYEVTNRKRRVRSSIIRVSK